MSYAIIGFGKIGHALAKAFARKGIEVSVATTRDPKSFAADAAAIGPTIIPKTLVEAVKADIVFLAVRFEAPCWLLRSSTRFSVNRRCRRGRRKAVV
jgi:predicted dinucleotide-binding enzyme